LGFTAGAPLGKIRSMHAAPLRFALPVLLLGLSQVACGPSIDAAAKADIDRRVAAFVPSGLGFPAPAGLAPKPLVVGQWTQHRLTSEKGEPSLITYKIVGEDSGAYWVEVANENYFGKTVTKILLAVGDRSNPNTMEIRAVKMKDKNGKVSEFQGPVLQLMQSTWQGSVNMLAVSWQGLSQETMNVVAGTFAGCFKARTDASWGAWHAASTAWMHPVVPISSLVKSVGIDRPSSMDLVGFGETGATSEIP
jgi:hypothetical protein